MAIDWTPVANSGTYTGLAEYRVENDGLVRWRGLITLTASPAVVGFPAEIAPIFSPIYMDWSGGPADMNILVSNAISAGNFNPTGQVIDLGPVTWKTATLPPAVAHTLPNVQAGLAAALRTIVGLRIYDFPSDRIETPAAVLSMPETPYDVTLSSRADEWTFPLWVLVAKADDKAAYAEMIPYLDADGAKSIRGAIEADTTLGGACDTAIVVRARPLFATVAGTEYLAVEFTLEVYT